MHCRSSSEANPQPGVETPRLKIGMLVLIDESTLAVANDMAKRGSKKVLMNCFLAAIYIQNAAEPSLNRASALGRGRRVPMPHPPVDSGCRG